MALKLISHEKRKRFFAGGNNSGSETGIVQCLFDVGLQVIFVLDNEDQRRLR